MRTRPLGLGSTTLQAGTDMYGYYGKYQGIITPNALITLAGITEGTTKNDAYNDPTENITWLKFSHNYKTLFVADRTIHYSVSWNHLESKGLVFGKVVEIGGYFYLLRLLQGANINPAGVAGGASSNDEWDSLIGAFTPDTADSHWYDSAPVGVGRTKCQEIHSSGITLGVRRGGGTLSNFSFTSIDSSIETNEGYRPVLEIL